MPLEMHLWSTFPKYRTLSVSFVTHSNGEDIGLFLNIEKLEDVSCISIMVDVSKI